jgi:hypothetical protein
MDFYFKPLADGFDQRILRVSPDILPPNSIKIGACEIDGEKYTNFAPQGLEIALPDSKDRVKVKVQIVPN